MIQCDLIFIPLYNFSYNQLHSLKKNLCPNCGGAGKPYFLCNRVDTTYFESTGLLTVGEFVVNLLS